MNLCLPPNIQLSIFMNELTELEWMNECDRLVEPAEAAGRCLQLFLFTKPQTVTSTDKQHKWSWTQQQLLLLYGADAQLSSAHFKQLWIKKADGYNSWGTVLLYNCVNILFAKILLTVQDSKYILYPTIYYLPMYKHIMNMFALQILSVLAALCFSPDLVENLHNIWLCIRGVLSNHLHWWIKKNFPHRVRMLRTYRSFSLNVSLLE